MNLELGEIQTRFAELIWEKEPIASGELVKICDEKFGWKKSTTYTVLKTLCEKEILINEGGLVKALISRETFYTEKSMKFVDETFQGSLPEFVAAFSAGRKLSKKDADILQEMIDRFRENS